MSDLCYNNHYNNWLYFSYIDIFTQGTFIVLYYYSKKEMCDFENNCHQDKYSPAFFKEYLTQNVIFHIKICNQTCVLRIINTKISTSHVTKLDMK